MRSTSAAAASGSSRSPTGCRCARPRGGGAARNLSGAALAARGGAPAAIQGALLTAAALRELIAELADRPPGRRALPGIKAARADIILAAALVLEAVLDETGADALEITRAGLREGVFFAERLLAGASPLLDDVRAATVRNLVAQHALDAHRAQAVAALALELRASLGVVTAPGERELLWAAAMLHELGGAIDLGDQPLHARYVLLNSALYGYGPREVAPARAGGPARLVPDDDGLRVELAGDARLSGWALARLAHDDALPAALGRPLLADRPG